jgi:hypothetical protein
MANVFVLSLLAGLAFSVEVCPESRVVVQNGTIRLSPRIVSEVGCLRIKGGSGER